jgi:signal transduction histidine kinase
VKASLLRRMIFAQGLVLALLWLVSALFALVTAYWKPNIRDIDDSLYLQSSALVTLLQDERDPARFQLQARRIAKLAEENTRLDTVRPGEYRALLQVCDRQGRLLFRSAAAPETPFTLDGPGFHLVARNGERWRVLVATSADGGLRALAAESLSLRKRIIWREILRFPTALLVVFGFVALFTWLGARVALRPLFGLARVVAARAPDELQPLEGHGGLVETRPLVQALNGLLARVRALLDGQRQFLADAAHELRTPLAVIGTQAHILANAGDGVARSAAAQELQQGIERGGRLVSQLLAVARLDAAEPGLRPGPLDLAALIQGRVASLVAPALAKRLDLGYEGPERLPWRGDEAILASAVENVLGNAVKFTPPGGRITARLERRDGVAVLEVADTGPGIPPPLREAAFQRFTRLPGHQEPGSGLGLAIVRRAVELHGGAVALASPERGPGLVVRFTLPG